MAERVEAEERGAGLPHWPVRASETPPSGLHVRRMDLDEAALAALSRHLCVVSARDFALDVTVRPHGENGLKVQGRVGLTVVQTCVVTLEPMESRIDEAIDAGFRPPNAIERRFLDDDDEDGPVLDAASFDDDPLVAGTIDLGALAVEHLALGVDPYPRKPGVVFEAPADAGEGSPFAALSRLKDKR